MYTDFEKQITSKPIAPRSLKRIQKDIKDVIEKPLPGIFILPDEDNMRKMTVLITGPKDSGYHGGMFIFLIGFTDDYPMKPPVVKCLTAARKNHQLHRHIFVDGSVCLSVLNTGGELAWSPVMTLTSMVLILQSFLTDPPYYTVAGYNPNDKESVKKYNTTIMHEVIKVTVIDVMESINKNHEYFVQKIKDIFNEHYDHYTNFCNENMHLDGQSVDYPYGGSYKLEFKILLNKIESIKQRLV